MLANAFKSFSSKINSDYTLATNPSFETGVWRVYEATRKSTGKTVSVFVFDRKQLEANGRGLGPRSASAANRKLHEEVAERLKKEASLLARLRHPNVLELVEPVEETRNGLMFATEFVTASLSTLLEDENDNAGFRKRAQQGDGESTGALDEIEIQKGVLQIGNALEFLHDSAGLVHGNLTPDAIFLNAKADWKLGGLGFAGPVSSTNTTGLAPMALSEVLYFEPRLPQTIQLNLDYAAPDMAMDNQISTAADMFSLGILLVVLYSRPHVSPIKASTNLSTYKRLLSTPSTIPMAKNNYHAKNPLPELLVSEVLPRLITRKPENRINARDFQNCSFFDNILVSTLRFLEAFPAKSPVEKTQFLKGFPQMMSQFPKTVLENKVLPNLLEESKDRAIVALLLGNAFKIASMLNSPQAAINDKIIPKLREIFPAGKKAERDPTKDSALAIVLDNLEMLAKNSVGGSFKDGVLPLVNLALSLPNAILVEKALNTVSLVIEVIDFTSVKNDLFPSVAHVFQKTDSLAIKVCGLNAFLTLCGGNSMSLQQAASSRGAILDKYTIQEKIVPLIKVMKTREPNVMIAALPLLDAISTVIDTEFLAFELMPIMWTFALGPLLNLEQFSQYMQLIQKTVSHIQQDHGKKLQETVGTSGAQGSGYNRSNGQANGFGGSDSVGEVDSTDYANLVFGRNAKPETPADPWAASLKTMSSLPMSAPISPPASNWPVSSASLTPNLPTASMSGMFGAAIKPPPALSNSFSTANVARTVLQPSLSPGSNPWAQISPTQPPPASNMSTMNQWANYGQVLGNLQNNQSLNQAMNGSNSMSLGNTTKPKKMEDINLDSLI